MSSARWPEPAPAEDIGLELALLCDALDMPGRGGFLFAICEEEPLRERLMQHVREHLEAGGIRGLIEVELSPDQPDLAGQLEQQLLYESPDEGTGEGTSEQRVRDRPRSPVVFVHTRGLAGAGMRVAYLPEEDPERVRVERIRRALRALNFQRERLSRLNVPLVFWLSQSALGQVMQHAADVFAARSGLFFFETPQRAPSAPPPMRSKVIVGLLDHFHRTLLPPEELRRRAALYERRLERERGGEKPYWPGVAFLCRDLANMYHELDDYARAGEFQDAAIEAYQRAIAERDAGDAGDKRQERAALQFRLGLAHHDRMRGKRAENLACAIQCYREALRVYTPEAAPLEFAGTQNNLGLAYANLPTGDRAANLQQAIGCYREALRFRTPEAAPLDYATTQNNLGSAYADLPTGDRAANLQQAIGCYREALRFRTPEAAPLDYAMAQNNLGTAYAGLPTGDRAANLQQAIACYREALRFRTPEAAPLQYAMTQNNLGLAYADLPTGDRAANLQRAIECFNNALAVLTAEAFPHYHEIATRNLEQALSHLAQEGEPKT